MTTTDSSSTALTTPAQVGDSRGLNVFSSESAFTTGQRMAKALSSSTLVPKEYKGKLPNVLIAMELAARIGASVFAVMQNIDIIHGRPAWRATFLIATVNASGRFSPLRFRFQGDEGSDAWGCRAYATDRETGEECVGALITLALANAEGWSKKNGSKWKTMPEQMLMYRAAAFWCRVYAPELSLGMHTTDEVSELGGAVVVQDGQPAKGTAGISAVADRILGGGRRSTVEPVETEDDRGEDYDDGPEPYDPDTGEFPDEYT